MEVFTNIYRGAIGIAFLVGLSYLLSTNRKAINWRLVTIGLFIQIMFALGVMKVHVIHIVFKWISERFVSLISIFHKGIEFLFGNLADASQPWAFVFAIQVLPTIIIFSALSSLLYYFGILQRICFVFAWLLSKSMKLSGAESLSTAANIFLGQTEAPIMIRPYLAAMNKSEILCIMIGGMANTAGSVLGAYVQMLGGNDPDAQAYYALHLLTQSIISAPAAIVISKMLFPNTDELSLDREIKVSKEYLGSNFLDAISIGTTDGLRLAVNVGAMLIVFTALVYLFDATLFKIGSWTQLNPLITDLTNQRYDGLSLRLLFGYLFAPVAWLIGTPAQDIFTIGQLLGEKTMINEFYAYGSFSKMLSSHILEPLSKSTLIATYALSGFANFASIGIQIGGISTLAPNQRTNLSEMGMKALIGGTIACLMTACVAGMMYSS
ncbi:MAG: nucleoside transporter C-terminal domain-containing protein [Saprospiraceae bacterium]|nr:Na+ dependent nucleoside transporter [Saprospiraceae bacterium]MBK8449056.1 Na+ dependent nucleoside transporter [Saprospiraceae bacterium]MBK9223295.1 Na+ dependent nucleoside transporter [Saprospiraceae bacterium]